jgi:hypothetical protein
MNKKRKQLPKSSTCDFCKSVARFESVKTIEPGPYAILYYIGGKAIGFIRADPQKRDMLFYCEKHVPRLSATKIRWLKKAPPNSVAALVEADLAHSKAFTIAKDKPRKPTA